MENNFHIDQEHDWEVLDPKVKRKVCVYNEQMMLVKVKFETGGIGVLHRHPHIQISYVSAGKFSYTIGDETKILHTGDSCIIPSNVLHGCECLESGELIDSFNPHREDFI